VGGYPGDWQPGRGIWSSEPQLHISREGDPYLRTLLVQGAQHILGTGSVWTWRSAALGPEAG